MDNNNYSNNDYSNNDYSSNEQNGSQENYNPYAYNPYMTGQEADHAADQEADHVSDQKAEYAADHAETDTAGTGSDTFSHDNSNSGSSFHGGSRRKHKKSGNFGKTMGRTAAIALVFGLVAGGTFTGVSYAGTRISGKSSAKAAVGQTATAAELAQTTASTDEIGTAENVVSEKTSTTTVAGLTDVSSIAEEVMPSIVAITNTSTTTYQTMWGQSYSSDSESCGSGIIIDQDDTYLYIATNNHVVSGAESLKVQFSDEDKTTVDAETKGTYESGDLAVVQVKLSDLSDDLLNAIKVITVGDSTVLKVGEPTIAIGNALGYGQSVTTGVVSALGRSVTTQDETTGVTYTHDNLIQTDAAINPGNSGGALLNAEGELIGINSVKYSSTSVEGIGYAIPMEDAYPIIESLISSGSYTDTTTAYLGISGADVTEEYAQMYNMPQGVYVAKIYTGSGAEEAALQTGDIITQLGDTEITSMSDLKKALKDYTAGDTVQLVISRRASQNSEYQSLYVEVKLISAADMQSLSQGVTQQ